ncbi:hypothetical protein TWF694_001548 [Orbilia ellipsospora]|uniref:tyrosinase n=1 Tax=Orbilia ellipsospora TaxID=2528407 RepID=A0AAV9XS44_9PEZI
MTASVFSNCSSPLSLSLFHFSSLHHRSLSSSCHSISNCHLGSIQSAPKKMANTFVEPGSNIYRRGVLWVLLLAFACILSSVSPAGTLPAARFQPVGRNAAVQEVPSENEFRKRQINEGTTFMFTVSSTVTVTVGATHPVSTSPTSVSRSLVSAATMPDSTSTSRIVNPSISTGHSSSMITRSTSHTDNVATTSISSPSRLPSSSRASSFVSPPPIPLSTPRMTSTVASVSSSISASSSSSPSSFVPVVGAGNTCVDRLKIEDMQTKYPDTFNLLLLAWRELQLAPETDDLSFYQLSRIHGAPFGPWQMPAQGNYNWQLGYCTHHSAIFLSWHRPYLVLLEVEFSHLSKIVRTRLMLVAQQTLYRKAVEVANRFSGDAQTRFVRAASGVRLPYWDWSDPTTQSHLPTIVKTATVFVIQPGPSGVPTSATIPNPLYAYNFQSQNSTSTFWADFSRWRTTLRQPNQAAQSQEEVADGTLQNAYNNRHQATYLAFSYSSFNDFAANVETIHDEVHGSIGGAGHMTYIPYSAYDPVFWLHHCNMDRLMAMYQSAQPNTFIEPMTSVPTFANPSSQLDTIDTPLYPFRRFDNSFWTPQNISTASSIFPLSYGYPEVPCLLTFTSFDTLRNHTTTAINQLYGPQSPPGNKRSVERTKVRQEWQARVVIDRAEILGSFVIYVFLGKPDSSYCQWAISPAMIGTLTHLGSPGLRMKSRVIGANVILTNAINKALGGSPTKEQVIHFARENLNWVAISVTNTFMTVKLAAY